MEILHLMQIRKVRLDESTKLSGGYWGKPTSLQATPHYSPHLASMSSMDDCLDLKKKFIVIATITRSVSSEAITDLDKPITVATARISRSRGVLQICHVAAPLNCTRQPTDVAIDLLNPISQASSSVASGSYCR